MIKREKQILGQYALLNVVYLINEQSNKAVFKNMALDGNHFDVFKLSGKD